MRMIVAHANQRAIGKENTLPWRLAEDMMFFKATTLEHVNLLVGKNTLMSLPNQQLPNRKLHVLSSQYEPEGEEVVVRSVNEALQLNSHTPLMVIGGQQVYEAMLPFAAMLYVTRISLDVEGADTFFPEYEGDFVLHSVIQQGIDSKGLEYSIEEWRRVSVDDV